MEEWEHWLEITFHPVNQKKMSKGPVYHTKKMSRIQPASQWDMHIYIHVHNLFV